MKKYCTLLFVVALMVSAQTETVIKNSVPFSFPTVVGIIAKNSFQAKNISFVFRQSPANSKMVDIAWGLPVQSTHGVITIYTVAGALVKTFAITSRTGSVKWDVSTGKKVGNGVYFATLSSGSFNTNQKIILY